MADESAWNAHDVIQIIEKRAAQIVSGTRPDVQFLIAGAGPEEKRLRRLVSELRLTGQVTFVPNVFDFGDALAAMARAYHPWPGLQFPLRLPQRTCRIRITEAVPVCRIPTYWTGAFPPS